MKSKNKIILEVVLPTPVRRSFDYLPPENNPTEFLTERMPQPGCRVLVPFGNSERLALIIKVKNNSELSLNKLKPCLKLLDEHPLLDKEILTLAKWASTYYHYSLGSICFKMLPTLLRSNAQYNIRQQRLWRSTSKLVDISTLSRAPKQRQCLEIITKSENGIADTELKKLGISAAPIKKLQQLDLIEDYFIELGPLVPKYKELQSHTLNEEQLLAISQCELDKFKVHLLDGITGSGKTEVYLQLIEKKLKENKQVLVLVPEIGLTPQLISRFEQRLKMPIGLLHSGLNNQERLENWMMTVRGQFKILIGTRSALFTPMKNLGLIILDEEHDSSFKQSQGWLYSARDLALVRARDVNIPVVLGSATPSLESLQHALTGQYHHLKLRTRPGATAAVKFKTVDIKRLPVEQGLSKPLIDNIASHLKAGNQVIIFLNRRGFAPVLMCHDCGWMANCQRCETSYTLHQSPTHLHCHHCNGTRAVPKVCNDCKGTNITPVGIGTERVEAVLQDKFPNFPLVRIDRDSTRRKDALKNYLKDINSGHYKILVGTQMLSKGHHFPDVSLVAILDMDGSLFSSDFRAPEKFAQLLTQVAGRAGRAEKPGTVMLQTHHPEHPELRLLLEKGYADFAKYLLENRKQCLWPPFSYLAMFRAESSYRENPQRFLQKLANFCRGNPPLMKGISLLGPIEAPMPRRAGKYRCQLLFQADSRQSLQNLLRLIIIDIESKKTAKTVRWSLDVDPLEMF